MFWASFVTESGVAEKSARMSKLVAEVTNEENEVADSRSPNLGGTAEQFVPVSVDRVFFITLYENRL